ncbi:MAG: glycosyltransferase [Vicingaceae bacterium]
MKSQKTVLVCPLNWGLGHATRCVPIIEELIKNNYKVLLAADGLPKDFLKNEFPDLPMFSLPGYIFKYSKRNSWWHLYKESLRFKKSITYENILTQKLVKEQDVDVIISDNRYGVYAKDCKSVLLTHQLNLKVPFGKSIVNKHIKNWASNFSEIWIPDDLNINLSGELSNHQELKIHSQTIGILSRFEKYKKPEGLPKIDIVAVISGPEPQRTIFENKIINQLKDTDLQTVIVSGKVDKNQIETYNNIKLFSKLESHELFDLMCAAKMIVSRPGYTTLMDLQYVHTPVLFVPTPNQFEQEYLANIHKNKSGVLVQKQKELNIVKAYEKLKVIQITGNTYKNELLRKAVQTI